MHVAPRECYHRGMGIRLLTIAVLFTGLLVGTQPVWAQLTMAQAKDLETRYKGKPERLRDLVSDSKIRFDAAGNLVGKWHPGRWTWNSTLEITEVEAQGKLLKIKANRLLLNYSRANHAFGAVRSGTVEIEIKTNADCKVDPDKEWEKEFLKPAEDYPLEMQPYWKPFFACVIRPKTDECEFYEKRSWEAGRLQHQAYIHLAAELSRHV
jgi:hypothetical protein